MAEHKADDFIRLEAVPDHWRQTPALATVMVLDVPEEATRIAMLKTGKADIAAASLPVIDQYVDIQGSSCGKAEREVREVLSSPLRVSITPRPRKTELP